MTLIVLVVLVGVRLDVVSVLYALWLCGLFSLRRPQLARVWPVFVVFAAVLTPLQYLLALGLPAGLCYGKSAPVSYWNQYAVSAKNEFR